MPSFPQKYGFENARKNLRPFSQIFGPGPFAGSLSQNLPPGEVFQLDSSLCWDGYALRMCPQLVNKMCSVKKQQSPPKSSGGACLAGRPSRKQPWKNRKKSHDEVLHQAWRKRLRGNTIRGNRTESLWEGNLPLRGSLRGRTFRSFQRSLEVFRGFQRFLRGFQRFLRGFQRSSQRPSQRQISLSQALGLVAPNRVAP